MYYKNFRLHRDDGPALNFYYKNGQIYYEEYYKSGNRHRDGSPALNYYYEHGSIRIEEYWLNDEYYNDMLQWMVAVGNLD